MKVFKRNAVILTVLLFVCVAVYLNWSYNRGQDLSVGTEVAENDSSPEPLASDAETLTTDDPAATDGTGETTDDAESGSLYYEDDSSTEYTDSSNYFDSARLTRQQARDSATATLQQAASVNTASQEERDNALNSIEVMAGYSVTEAQIENTLRAKDFSDCVVFISDEGVNVVVPAPTEGLSDTSVAKITETIMAAVDVSADQIKIVEVN